MKPKDRPRAYPPPRCDRCGEEAPRRYVVRIYNWGLTYHTERKLCERCKDEIEEALKHV